MNGSQWSIGLGLTLVLATSYPAAGQAQGAGPQRVTLAGHVPAVVTGLTPIGAPSAGKPMTLAIGLPLRNKAGLDALLTQLYDPASPNFHKFLSTDQFTARFGPTEQEYQAVLQFARANRLTVVRTHPNRLVVDVEGSVSNVESAFLITERLYREPANGRIFFASDTEPSVPANLAVADVWGLSDYVLPRPLAHPTPNLSPLNSNGTGPGGAYQGRDFRNAYAPGTTLSGAGQVAAVAEFDGYYASDIAAYEANCGYSPVPLTNILLSVTGTPGYSGAQNAVAEVSLDIEMLVAMAPGLAQLRVYEGNNPYTVFSSIATENVAKQISCSWAWSKGPTYKWQRGPGNSTLDSLLSQMAAQGQSFFQASGDSDADTGNQTVSSSTGPIPVDSIYVTSVGGTSLTMTGAGAAWSSETVWNWGNNTGSSGGVSPNYTIPYWQTNVSMSANSGSTVNRNFPDVALTADAIEVLYNNGSSGVFGGTSCAAPLWAGFTAMINQQSAASGSSPVGFLNPALYALAAGPNYSACFHDISTGNNIGNNTPGLYNAVPNYDLATGLGTPNGTNLINALVPPTTPYFITQPSSQTATNGANVSFSVSAGGQSPLSYRWLFNGTNLQAAGNVFGTTSSTLSLTSVTSGNAGGYSAVVTNSSGAVTSAVATLTIVFPPVFTSQPTNQTVVAGDNASFSATVSGTSPLTYHWRHFGTNLVNGGNVSGATTNVLNLVGVSSANAGSYSLVVTNPYGSATSSSASLTVLVPAAITVPPAAQSIQCGSNAAFTVTATGTTPLSYQWSVDGGAIAGATGVSFAIANVHLPSHTVTVAVTNLYGGATSSVPLTVQDTLPPVVTLNGSNPMYVELGGTFSDPGGTAMDLCAGPVPVTANATINTALLGTNSFVYSASDGNGNTGTATRMVVVRDTTPPSIAWSFTNLVLAASSNCVGVMPDVTGTNYIVASDLSGSVTVTQDPAANAPLPLGTNMVLLTAKDSSGNTAYSTNQLVVEDQAAPVIVMQPQDAASSVGGNAGFSVGATACTRLMYQWWFNSAQLLDQTNSSLALSNLAATDAGSYSVVVTASGGSVTSSVAVLTLISPSALALDASADPSGFKDMVTFTASVTPLGAGGTVQFLTNGSVFDSEPLLAGAALSAGVATLPRGTNLVVAIYSGDANDLPATNSLELVVTNHPPTVLPASYSMVAGSSLTIAVADLATNWSDVDGDAPFIASIAPSTNGVVVANTSPDLFYSNSSYVNDQFVCAISDGYGGTNYQTVNIFVVPQTNDVPNITALGLAADGGMVLQLSGGYGSSYVLEGRADLVTDSWAPLSTNSPDATGLWQYTDEQATNSPQRFYRLRLAQ